MKSKLYIFIFFAVAIAPLCRGMKVEEKIFKFLVDNKEFELTSGELVQSVTLNALKNDLTDNETKELEELIPVTNIDQETFERVVAYLKGDITIDSLISKLEHDKEQLIKLAGAFNHLDIIDLSSEPINFPQLRIISTLTESLTFNDYKRFKGSIKPIMVPLKKDLYKYTAFQISQQYKDFSQDVIVRYLSDHYKNLDSFVYDKEQLLSKKESEGLVISGHDTVFSTFNKKFQQIIIYSITCNEIDPFIEEAQFVCEQFKDSIKTGGVINVESIIKEYKAKPLSLCKATIAYIFFEHIQNPKAGLPLALLEALENLSIMDFQKAIDQLINVYNKKIHEISEEFNKIARLTDCESHLKNLEGDFQILTNERNNKSVDENRYKDALFEKAKKIGNEIDLVRLDPEKLDHVREAINTFRRLINDKRNNNIKAIEKDLEKIESTAAILKVLEEIIAIIADIKLWVRDSVIKTVKEKGETRFDIIKKQKRNSELVLESVYKEIEDYFNNYQNKIPLDDILNLKKQYNITTVEGVNDNYLDHIIYLVRKDKASLRQRLYYDYYIPYKNWIKAGLGIGVAVGSYYLWNKLKVRKDQPNKM